MKNILRITMIKSALKEVKFLVVALTILLTSGSIKAQNAFLPENLGDNINTVYAEINPVISPDGKTLYFTKVIPTYAFGELERQEIWYSKLQEDGKWGKAERMPSTLNIGRFNSVLSVNGDGNTLLINGVYNKKGNLWIKRGMSTITKNGESWSAPMKLKVQKFSKKNKGLYSNAFMSHDGNFMVMSFSGKLYAKKMKVYVSQKKDSGKWSAPKKLKKKINKKGSNEAPSLSADNKTLYFTRKKGKSSDIYTATRLADNWKKWSDPVKLSDTINSNKWDSYFKTNSKGSYAYYSSENNTKGQADIFAVKLYEENPFVLVSGTIINRSNNKGLSAKYNLKVMVDDKVIDSVKINKDSATYSIKLPFGKKYTLAANVPYFVSQKETVDATAAKEFTKVNKNLFVIPLPYVRISGKVSSRETGSVIPAEAEPKILIDGVVIDSIKIDPFTGIYSLQLPYGKNYSIAVSAIKHTVLSEKLELSQVNEYQELTANLYAELIKEKMAVISGFIFDKKTGKPLAGKKAKIFVNGNEAVEAEIDSVTNAYKITVPLKTSYTINASAGDYYPVFETIDLTNETENVKVMKDLNIVPIEIGQSVRLNNIFFASGKTTLKPESFPELDRVVQFLKENENIKVEIAGHTDNVGKAATNQQLSLGRAKSVANYITGKGVTKAQITFKGYGLTKPVADNKTAQGKAQNRRVEFTILDK